MNNKALKKAAPTEVTAKKATSKKATSKAASKKETVMVKDTVMTVSIRGFGKDTTENLTVKVPVVPEEVAVGKVSASIGKTTNLGDYNSLKVSASIEIPCVVEDSALEQAYEFAFNTVNDKVAEVLDHLLGSDKGEETAIEETATEETDLKGSTDTDTEEDDDVGEDDTDNSVDTGSDDASAVSDDDEDEDDEYAVGDVAEFEDDDGTKVTGVFTKITSKFYYIKRDDNNKTEKLPV